jgi:hypothetical protein
MTDPVVEEVRRIRDKTAKAFGYDAHAMVRYFIQQQKKAEASLRGAPRVAVKRKTDRTRPKRALRPLLP